MLRDLPVRAVMTTDVVSFTPDQNVEEAMRRLLDRKVDAGPVVNDRGEVVGMLSTGDLIVEKARVHFPTVVNFLGVNVTLPFSERKLDESMEKALGATVGDVMTARPYVVGPDDTIEEAATILHDNDLSRLPVVDDEDRLVGLVARGDIVRAIVEGDGDAERPTGGEAPPSD